MDVILAHGGMGSGAAQAIGVFWALIPLGAVVFFSARSNLKIRRQTEERARFEEAFRILEEEYRAERARKESVRL